MRVPGRIWSIVPVRGEASGKSRLAVVLDRGERMRFNRSALARTLAALAQWQGGLARCIVVSPCVRSLRAARAMGAIALAEPAPHGGLKRALARALKFARRNGAHRVLVLPADLASPCAGAFERMRKAARGRHAVIAPDRAGSGTNALWIAPDARFGLAYGNDSFARHLARMRARGWDVAVCADPRLAADVDTPEDLRRAPARAARKPMV
jgi:2-phospho-L-lactate guanylyltransferase